MLGQELASAECQFCAHFFASDAPFRHLPVDFPSRQHRIVPPQAAAAVVQQGAAANADAARLARLDRIRASAAALAGRSEADTSDSRYTPQLEDQDGNEVAMPPADRRALTLGCLLQAQGRKLLGQRRYAEAVDVLSLAEDAFGEADSTWLRFIDNAALNKVRNRLCTPMSIGCSRPQHQRHNRNTQPL